MLASEAIEIGLNQVIGPSSGRLLAVIDKNREMFIARVVKPLLKKMGKWGFDLRGFFILLLCCMCLLVCLFVCLIGLLGCMLNVERIPIYPTLADQTNAIGTMVDSFAWNDDKDMLAAVVDGKFIVWYYPYVVFIDEDIEPLTRFDKYAR
jgi:hypothetical protein